jgi:hypothetical protein
VCAVRGIVTIQSVYFKKGVLLLVVTCILQTADTRPFSGLDPAMPFFVTLNIDQKLDDSDAVFVDVIHTNAFVQGKIEACGDVDFYVNGGFRQPGCWSESSKMFICLLNMNL